MITPEKEEQLRKEYYEIMIKIACSSNVTNEKIMEGSFNFFLEHLKEEESKEDLLIEIDKEIENIIYGNKTPFNTLNEAVMDYLKQFKIKR